MELAQTTISVKNLEKARLPYDAAEAKTKGKEGAALERATEERDIWLAEYQKAENETLGYFTAAINATSYTVSQKTVCVDLKSVLQSGSCLDLLMGRGWRACAPSGRPMLSTLPRWLKSVPKSSKTWNNTGKVTR